MLTRKPILEVRSRRNGSGPPTLTSVPHARSGKRSVIARSRGSWAILLGRRLLESRPPGHTQPLPEARSGGALRSPARRRNGCRGGASPRDHQLCAPFSAHAWRCVSPTQVLITRPRCCMPKDTHTHTWCLRGLVALARAHRNNWRELPWCNSLGSTDQRPSARCPHSRSQINR